MMKATASKFEFMRNGRCIEPHVKVMNAVSKCFIFNVLSRLGIPIHSSFVLTVVGLNTIVVI